MQFVCSNCDRNFSSKQMLNNHVENMTCVKRLEKYTCDKCMKLFSSKRRLEYHLKQKICFKKNNTNLENQTLLELEKMKIELQIEEEKTKQKLIESEEKTKQKEIEIERTKQKQIEAEEKTKQKQIELEIVREKMIIKMKPRIINHTTTNNNTTNNNTYNIDIHPVPFGKEDLSELDDERVIKYILNRPAKAIEDIVNIVYCSKKNRLNHTVYIPARNKSIAMVSNGHRFVHRDAIETINEIYGNSKDKLDDILEANSDILTNHLTKCFSNIENDQKHEERVKKNIKFEMINMEPVVKTELHNLLT